MATFRKNRTMSYKVAAFIDEYGWIVAVCAIMAIMFKGIVSNG